MNGTERRKTGRVRYVFPASAATSATIEIRDISPRGACLQGGQTPMPDSEMSLNLVIRRILITVEADVVWCRPGAAFGVKFRNLTPGQSALIGDSTSGITVDRAEVRSLRCA